jgi:hypothetical protein
MEPDRMPDDPRRKAVATVGDFSHRASLPSASLPSYPVTLTTPVRSIPKCSALLDSSGNLGAVVVWPLREPVFSD